MYVRLWPKTICAGWIEVRKMTAYRFSIAPVGGFSLLFLREGGLVSGGSRLGNVGGTPSSKTIGWGVARKVFP